MKSVESIHLIQQLREKQFYYYYNKFERNQCALMEHFFLKLSVCFVLLSMVALRFLSACSIASRHLTFLRHFFSRCKLKNAAPIGVTFELAAKSQISGFFNTAHFSAVKKKHSSGHIALLKFNNFK